MSKKKVLILASILFLIILILFIIFYKNTTKDLQIGNNMSSQEIVDYFLNISSYETTVTVEISSNKNSNKYILNQKYIDSNTNIQEVIEPSNIAGVKIEKSEGGLKLENSNLNLSKIFENYTYIADNCLDLSSFIETYKTSNQSSYEETENQIIMKTKSSNDNKYTKYRTLYINKETCMPEELEIKDTNQNTIVNIQYNEVKINSTK